MKSFNPLKIFALLVGFGVCFQCQTFGDQMQSLGAAYPNNPLFWSISDDSKILIGQAVNFQGENVDDYLVGIKIDGTKVVQLSQPGYNSSIALGVSGDGKVVIGAVFNDTSSSYGEDQRAFRFENGTMSLLNGFSGPANSYTRANGVSRDGKIIVGSIVDASGIERSVIWTDGAPNQIPISDPSYAKGVSGDGKTVVGGVYDNNKGKKGVFLFKEGAVSFLPDPESPSTGFHPVEAMGISQNGSTVIGNLVNETGLRRGFVYQNNRTIDIGTLSKKPGGKSEPWGVSRDGAVVVGRSSTDYPFKQRHQEVDTSLFNDQMAVHAFKYENGKMTDLGYLGTDPSNESWATSVSPDGKSIFGLAFKDDGTSVVFLYGANAGTILNVQDWMSSLSGVNSSISMANTLASTPMEGAHHRPLSSYANQGKATSVWATGDFASISNPESGRVLIGEIGVSYQFDERLIVGAAWGVGERSQDLQFGGKAHVTGNYVLAELDYTLPGGICISLTDALGFWGQDVRRAYTVTGGVDSSKGGGDITTNNARIRVDGPKVLLFDGIEISPFVSYSIGNIQVAGYAESDGSYPAAFADSSRKTQEGAVGIVATVDLTKSTKIRASGEIIRRFDRHSGTISGTYLGGALNFDVPTAVPIRDQFRAGLDIDQSLSSNLILILSGHIAGEGQRPTLSLSSSVRYSF